MGSSKQTSRIDSGPWGPTQGPLKTGIERIEQQYQTDIANPNRLVPQASGYVSDVLGGKFLDPSTNPHLGALTDAILDPIQARVSAQFGRAGRGTSAGRTGLGGAVSQAMTAGLAAPLFAQYGQERALQQGAAGLAAPLDATSSLPLEQYLERLRAIGSLGKKGKTTTTSSPSPLQTIAGLGLTAVGALSGNPMMAMGGMRSVLPGGVGAAPY